MEDFFPHFYQSKSCGWGKRGKPAYLQAEHDFISHEYSDEK